MLKLLLLILFIGCQKKNTSIESVETSQLPENISILSNEHTPTLSEHKLQIADLIDFNTNEKITLDSPKRFIQVTILFTLEQLSNYQELMQSTNISDEQIQQQLTASRKNFYQKLGLSEEEYIQYSMDNAKFIEEFLENNTDFANAYELTLSQTIH